MNINLLARFPMLAGIWLLTTHAGAAPITWVGTDGDWSTPSNWSGGFLPGTNDDVVIDQPGLLQITHSNGTHRVGSLRCEETLFITGGTLGVGSGISEVNGDLRAGPGTTLEAVGPSTLFRVLNATNIDGANLIVSGGATLSLPALRSYHKGSGCGRVAANWQVSGKSSLDLSGLTELTGGDCTLESGLIIRSVNGGQVLLNNLVVIPDSYVSLSAENTNSTVDLSGLVDYQGANFNLSLMARDGGNILVPQLVNGHRVLLNLQSGGIISTAQFRQLSGINLYRVSLSLPAVTNIDGANLIATGGRLSLPELRSYHASSGCPFVKWEATGTDSSLELPTLSEINIGNCGSLSILGTARGLVILSNLVTLADGTVAVTADANGSLIDLSGLTRYQGPDHQLNLTARNSGRILIPKVTELTRSSLFLGTPGGFLTDQIQFLSQTMVTIDGVTNSFNSLIDVTNTTFTLLNRGRILSHSGVERTIQLNQLGAARLPTPFSADTWVFAGTANQQIQFDLVNISKAGLLFSLTGPNGWTGFSAMTNDAPPVTLPSSGTYTLTATGVGSRPDYAIRLIDVTAAALSLNSPFQGQFWGRGQAQLFVITMTSGSPLQIHLSNAGVGNHTELYVSQGVPPTRGQFEYRSNGTGPNAQVVLPNATVGTWYVLVYGDTIATPSDFTLEATAASVLLTSISPDRQALNTDLTLTLNGGGFGQTSTVALLASDGTAHSPNNVVSDSTTIMTATFAADTLPVGTYSVRVSQADGASAVLPNALRVVPPGEPKLELHLVVPSFLGRHAPATLYVEYTNSGVVPMSAALVTLRATDRALLTLDAAETARGLWAAVKPECLNDSVQFLASGPTPGILQPGETGRIPIYYAGLLRPWNPHDAQVDFDLTVLQADDTSTIDWTPFEQGWRPAWVSPEAWLPIWTNFLARVGTQASRYVSVLADDQAYLGRLGINERDVTTLLAFELQRAAGLHVFFALATIVDASVDAPGLLLQFGRSFGIDIMQRYQLGALGRGWSHNWERSLVQEPDGSIRILDPNISVRVFQPDQRSPSGGYFSEPGNHRVLTRLSDGTFSLRELSGTTTYFGADGNLLSVEDPNGNRITAVYVAHQLNSLTHSSGQFIQLTYNAAGRISQVADSQGHTNTYSYDSSGEHLLSVTAPGGVTTYAYVQENSALKRHALASMAFPGGTHLFFSYDGNGRLSGWSRDGGAEPVTIGYEGAGKVTFNDAQAHTTQKFFDHRGLPAKRINALGGVTAATFDANFNLTQKIDPIGQSSTFTHDSRGNLMTAKDPRGATTRFTYTASLDRLESLTDPRGNLTRYAYDAYGNQIASTNADLTVAHATFDLLGNLSAFTNRRGDPIRYTRDVSGRVIRKLYSNNAHVDYRYDSRGNLFSLTDTNGVVAMQYDFADQMTNIAYPDGHSLQFTYDAGGRRTALVDETGYAIKYAYDAAGRLSHMTDGGANVLADYSYDAAGWLSQKTLGNGVKTSYSYNANGQVLFVVNQKPDSSLLSSYEYGYDSVGQPVTMTVTRGYDLGLPVSETQNYTYDSAGQLTGVGYSNGRSVTYKYDEVGNRVRVSDNGVIMDYIANELNQYTSAGGTTYHYDADGNLVNQARSGVTTSYIFDAENHLVGMTTPTDNWSYSYDALGNRTGTTRNGQTTHYLVDPHELGDVVAEFNGGGQLVARYEHGVGLVARMAAAGGPDFYTFSTLGHTSELTDTAGTPVNSYAYDPFAYSLGKSETVPNPFQYVGEFGVMTEDSGLISMRARYYGPMTARFLSRDPVGIRAGDVNLYGYVRNSPTVLTDPSGLQYGCPACPHPEGPEDDYTSFTDHPLMFSDNPQQIFLPPEPPIMVPPPPPGPYGSISAGSGRSASASSGDPNSKTGPSGVGELGFLRSDQLLTYRIDFENDARASAPAQQVTISDPLSTNFDLSTFRLSEIGFGDVVIPVPDNLQHFETDVPIAFKGADLVVHVEASLRYALGEVYAAFYSIDPETSLPPPVDIGFLPPEDGTGRGQGHISYSIKAKPGLPTGTAIRNVAHISFDNQMDIATNQRDPHNPAAGTDPAKEALNTIDVGPPASRVAVLPAESGRAIELQWSGEDDNGGSGIGSYDIYVATNGGTLVPLLQGTNATSATFYGQEGNVYSFYSIAHDQAANTELPHPTADATTTVVTGAPVLDPITNLVVDAGQVLSITNILHGTPQGSFIYSLGPTAAPGATIDATTGLFHWTPACAEGGTTNTFAFSVVDSARSNISDVVQFTVVVRPCLQPQAGSPVFAPGNTIRLPVELVSTAPLVSLSALVSFPTNQLVPLAIEPFGPAICAADLSPAIPQAGEERSGEAVYLMSLDTCANQSLVGTRQVAWLVVTTTSNPPSGFLRVQFRPGIGSQPDGAPATNYLLQAQQIVVVGQEPLLEAVLAADARIELNLYALPVSTIELQSRESLSAPDSWSPSQLVTATNLSTALPPLSATNRQLFWRAIRK